MTDLRSATRNDLDALTALYAAFFAEDGIAAEVVAIRTNLARMLAQGSARIWVAEDAGEIVGLSSATSTVGVEFGLSVEIEDLYVVPARRGEGLARRLIAEPLAWAQEIGAAECFLVITPEAQADQDLIRFYERFGFTLRDRLMMSRDLAP